MAASLTMCLQSLGITTNEDEVNKVMGCRPGMGASWEDAIAAAQHFGARATLVSPASVHQMKSWTDRGVPIMIAWNPEGRDWSHASVVYDVDHKLNVHVADPNCPDPEDLVRILPKKDFYAKWYEKMPQYLFRRPACAIEREITPDGRQVMASALKNYPEPEEHRSSKMSYLISLEEMEDLLTKQAVDEEKISRFEKGKPADPTKNMSKEDAEKWHSEKEKNKDKFKKAKEDDEDSDDKEARYEKGPMSDAEKEKLDPEFKAEIGKHPLPKKAARERITETIEPEVFFGQQKEAAMKSGLYGFTKKTQKDCESAVSKLRKYAVKIAKDALDKDARVGDFLSIHAKRHKSSSAKLLLAALQSSVPQYTWEEEDNDDSRVLEASPRKYSMYGYPEKTSRVALNACSEVKEAAGRVASELHSRRSDKYENITGFLSEHSKVAKCHEAKMILSFYPESSFKFASSVPVNIQASEPTVAGQKLGNGWVIWED